jgi:glyoxylase-like metal-dependent hydrolase (beta-lactamase superfamily II)
MTESRQATGLDITKVSVGPFDNNAYLLRDTESGAQVLIDAANEAPVLLSLIGERGLDAVVTTHQHADHWQALSEVVAATGSRSLAHPADAAAIPVVTSMVSDGDVVAVGSVPLEVIHIVGHTPGSIVLLYRDPAGPPLLWTGDSLFPGGVGNTDHDPVRFTSLINDVERKLFDRLPDETVFFPGHGADSTLGAERPALAEWRARGW